MATGTVKKVTNDSGTGYCKMPDGTLIQWGSSSIVTKQNAVVENIITYPIPFYDANMAIAVDKLTSATSCVITANAFNNTTMTIAVYDTVNNTTRYFTWLAIGRWKA